MKTRSSFVSNSSSTSFIAYDAKTIKEYPQLTFHKVKDIIDTYNRIPELLGAKNIPDFLSEELAYIYLPYRQELDSLYKENPNAYISDSYDRDQAYREDICLECFAGDL